MNYSDHEEANYWFSIFSFIDLLKRYGQEQVMFDLEDTLRKIEDEYS